LIRRLILLTRVYKQIILILTDSFLLITVLLTSFSLRIGSLYWPTGDLFWIIFCSPLIAIPIFIRFHLYNTIIRFIGFQSIWATFQAISIYSLTWGMLAFMAASQGTGSINDIPRSIIFINWILALVTILGLRMLARWMLTSSVDREHASNVMIYGAGAAGRQLSIALLQSNEYNIAAFIDDEIENHGQTINGIRVSGPADIKKLIDTNRVTEILMAVPTLSRSRRKEIINFLEPFQVLVRSLPSVSELAKGKVKIDDLREVTIKDLLGRDTVLPNQKLLSSNITNKVVMVTGAGGSIGSELCRQILTLNPSLLVLFELSEFALYTIHRELSNGNPSIKILPFLGSVNNNERVGQILKSFSVQTIYHAAAYKHVPMVEFNNNEGVNNNIFGTLSCAEAAIEHKVETFVLISTDKAVRPTSTMGTTKRFAELILQGLSNQQVDTRFTMVRFGNVLGSSGSVIPLFKKQINEGGPITVTSSKMIRYFMTIPEAVELVIQAGSMGKGGDVFVLNMGDPVSITELAQKMIRLSGLEIKDESNPNGDIEILYTGIRPGEKLFEELIIGDNISQTDHPMIMRAKEEEIEWTSLKVILKDLEEATFNSDYKRVRELLTIAVPDFKPQSPIQDFLFSENSK
jgi:FlaA1/EpsC-like NDP-sugar epimerase